MSDFAVKIILSESSPIPDYDVAPWDLGTLEVSSGDATTGDSYGLLADCSPVGEYADIAQGGNYVAVGDWTVNIHAVTPGRAKWWDAFRAAGASMYGARVELWDATNDLCRAVGVVTDAALDGVEVRVECESILTARHKDIPARRLTEAEFPGLPESAQGQPVPTLYGPVSGLDGTALVSDREYYDDACISRTNPANALDVSSRPTSIWVTVGANSGVLIDYQSPGVSAIPTASSYPSWVSDVPGGDVYIEITDGTGSGQSRQVTSVGSLYSWVNTDGATLWFLGLTFAAAWDPLPGSFDSVMRVYSQDLDGVLIVADEAQVSSVIGINDDQRYPVMFVQGSSAAGVTADLSASLSSGADIETIIRLQPEIYDAANVVDGILSTSTTYANVYAGEVLPGVSATDRQISPWYDQILSGIRGFAKAKTTTAHYSSGGTTFTQYVSAVRVSGINDVTSKYLIPDDFDSFPPWVIPGGTAADLSDSALVATSRNIAEYARVDSDLEVSNLAHGPISEQAPSSVTFTNGSASLAMTGLVEKAPTFTAGSTDLTLCKIRPKGCPRGQWIGVASYVTEPGFPQYANAITLSSTWPYATFSTADGIEVLPADQIFDVQISEIGIGLVVGGLNAASEYRVSVSSGRTYSASWPALPSSKANGDPITLARDAALDLLYRDLALPDGDVDFASFQALPANAITAALVDVERSDNIVARMAQEFNWIVSHDGSGRERAASWLDRMWTEDQDWTITNSDIIQKSMQEKTTSIDDAICQPSLRWSWTQADGFRSSAIVSDVTVDPDSLTSGNYLATISGFGDLAESKAILEDLQSAYSSTLQRGEKTIEWLHGGDPMILYVDSKRMWWAASRKRILDFKISENHAAMASAVGDRVEVTHRRATAGSAVYGTLAGRWWHPVDGTVQLLVMLDPPVADLESNLFVDTIDASGIVEQYIDQRDGVTEQYIDSLGA